ncbi:hypothetical protein KY366_04910 [Candidatus Woesearchaeota archaeon]|nr:hypothetical protein [Candidatus Woesearchaeota archaeon]
MDWKEFFKTNRLTIGIPILLFIGLIVCAALDSNIHNGFYSAIKSIPDTALLYFSIRSYCPSPGGVNTNYSVPCTPPTLPFTILGLLIIYFIVCTIRYNIIRIKNKM